MKILVTGANGFLGYYLIKQLLGKKMNVIATGKGSCRLPFAGQKEFTYCPMDFTDAIAVNNVFEKFRPDIIVHAGAMSKPDDCEVYQELAFNVNVTGTKNILLAAEKEKSFLVFISTDFIFDGEQGIYKEEDESHPVNYYGETKVHAEELVKKYNYAFAIIRTILVYGKPLSGKNNILTIVKEKLEKGEKYKVVNDQVRTPTYVEDLASAIITVIEKKATGIYHIGGKDVLTPYEMACKTADYLGLDKSLIRKVTQADFSQPAQRPLKTGFNISKAETELGYRPVSFEEGLRKTFS